MEEKKYATPMKQLSDKLIKSSHLQQLQESRSISLSANSKISDCHSKDKVLRKIYCSKLFN